MKSRSVFKLDSTERARTVDFARRLRSARNAALIALVPATPIAAATYGPLILPFIAAIVLGFAVLGRVMPTSRRPELALVAVLVWCQLCLTGMLKVGELYQLDALGLLILPAMAACALFPRRWMLSFTAWSALVMIGAAFFVDAEGLREMPPKLFIPLGVMLCIALPAAMIRQLDIESRDTAMVDPLTGALNRYALEARVAELTAQAHVLPLRVGVVMADLDHFKQINDAFGHDAGDVVLGEVVRRMRAVLGPLTPLYRAGGEEFAVLMAGAEEDEVRAVAERLRDAVGAEPIGDHHVTMSFGVAAATLDHFPVARIIEIADDALYRAKRGGRDQVACGTVSHISVLAELGDAQLAAASGSERRLSAADHAAVAEAADVLTSAATSVALGHDQGNWLVRGDFERDHMRTTAKALSRTHHGALGFVGLALAASIPWIGWALMVPAVPMLIAYHAVERLIDRIKRPEYWLGATWLGVQLAIFAGALIVEVGEPYLLMLFAPMLSGMTAVFATRGVQVNMTMTAVLMVLGGAFARPDLVTGSPGLVIPPLLVLVGIALMSSVPGRSAIEFRTKAVVDPLTGLLTRAALQSRLAEIGHESQEAGSRVSVIAFDVDHFKGLNDTHGHAVGDAVLRAVGTATRSNLHALEWGFRIGGDEFIVVVPCDRDDASRLAERLRAALADVDVDDIHITGSFGVAATASGESFDYDAVARRADAALYEAKRAGRNRVAVATDVAPEPAPVATVLRGAA
ncbi:MAG: GGDEF domain-containing protein [Solirubrobacteraceae bacterium]|nr:GGDEF domain-containing protein [Solirubrobacteraceae bacterium]